MAKSLKIKIQQKKQTNNIAPITIKEQVGFDIIYQIRLVRIVSYLQTFEQIIQTVR